MALGCACRWVRWVSSVVLELVCLHAFLILDEDKVQTARRGDQRHDVVGVDGADVVLQPAQTERARRVRLTRIRPLDLEHDPVSTTLDLGQSVVTINRYAVARLEGGSLTQATLLHENEAGTVHALRRDRGSSRLGTCHENTYGIGLPRPSGSEGDGCRVGFLCEERQYSNKIGG